MSKEKLIPILDAYGISFVESMDDSRYLGIKVGVAEGVVNESRGFDDVAEAAEWLAEFDYQNPMMPLTLIDLEKGRRATPVTFMTVQFRWEDEQVEPTGEN